MDQASGWYPDPDGAPDRLRWWDGDRWTDLTTSGSAPASGADRTGVGSGREERAEEVLAGPDGMPLAERIRVEFDRRWRALRGSSRATGVGVALVVVLVLVVGLLVRHTLPPTDTAGTVAAGPTGSVGPQPPARRVPPLATNCRAGLPTPEPGPSTPAPAGPRVSDPDAGISYAQMGAPWKPWDQFWFDPELRVRYRAGYYLITQHNVADTGTDYYATVLSGSVPATFGDALHPDMACVARHVADDARKNFYPQPNTRQELTDKPMVIDGHPGYLVKFHLTFDKAGYNAKGELAEVLVLDVGTPRVAVLYVSIPDTHRQFDALADKVIASVSVP